MHVCVFCFSITHFSSQWPHGRMGHVRSIFERVSVFCVFCLACVVHVCMSICVSVLCVIVLCHQIFFSAHVRVCAKTALQQVRHFSDFFRVHAMLLLGLMRTHMRSVTHVFGSGHVFRVFVCVCGVFVVCDCVAVRIFRVCVRVSASA
eukprot:GDKI01017721.1.p1 GENE.GDKI01017721.1~~GDKI01017721.1.p1  ORF type:complete len:148 (+),score=33.45 GDKI01017721.1:165-608(+)